MTAIPHTTPYQSGTHIQMPDGSLVLVHPERVEELYAAIREGTAKQRPLTADDLIRFAEPPALAAPEADLAVVQTPVETPVEDLTKQVTARKSKEA